MEHLGFQKPTGNQIITLSILYDLNSDLDHWI